MSLLNLFKSKKVGVEEAVNLIAVPKRDLSHIDFKVLVVEFIDAVEYERGRNLAVNLMNKEGIEVIYYDEPITKPRLRFSQENINDIREKGQLLIEEENADVIVWGLRFEDKIQLIFQSDYNQDNNKSIVSILDRLTFPANLFDNAENFQKDIIDIIYGAIIATPRVDDEDHKYRKLELLEKVIKDLSQSSRSSRISIDCMSNIMMMLGIVYHSFVSRNEDIKELNYAKEIFYSVIKNKSFIKNKIDLAQLYYHIASIYDKEIDLVEDNVAKKYQKAIEYYRLCLDQYDKNLMGFEYGQIVCKMADLLYKYWKIKEDNQLIRDAISYYREAEDLFSHAQYPIIWANIQGKLAMLLDVLGARMRSDKISNLAIDCYRNEQSIKSETRAPDMWASIQNNIGLILFRNAKLSGLVEKIQEAEECFKDALYVFEQSKNEEGIRQTERNLAKINSLFRL